MDSLVVTLRDDDFTYTREAFTGDEHFELMRKKGVFPYDWFTDVTKLDETVFPPRTAFYNKLADAECTIEAYARAKLVWDTMGCRSMRDYHDLYLKTDVLLLTDFFEKFRCMCLESYGLDAAHYFSAPGLAWDSALKITKVQLELFDNEAMYTFIERSIRGGVSQISKRFAKANNRNCRDYDPLAPISHLIYLDANNLYGWAMSQPLPTGGFRWLTDAEITTQFPDATAIQTLLGDDDETRGYIFEVDLEYPHHLHDRHSDYPLAPERIEIDGSMFSPFQQQTFPEDKKKPATRLAPNLRDKKNYVVHGRNLKFYLDQGMVLREIHRVLTFKQSAWLKRYIDFNTQMRSTSSSDFAKDFYKLMNNSVFGKTQENLRNRVWVEVVTNCHIARKRSAKPSFKRSMTIHEDLVIVQQAVTNLKLNKPLYVGFSVLELSKLHMYNFHYDKMLPRYERVNLCFTDTDSLLYEIETEDIYADMALSSDDYDFSAYPPHHPLYSSANKKVIGKFKDELNGQSLEEIIGILPKCYSLLYVDSEGEEQEKRTAKGSKRSVKDRYLHHQLYRETLDTMGTVVLAQNVIRSRAHELASVHQRKTALTAFDIKRWICADNINTLAYGHYHT